MTEQHIRNVIEAALLVAGKSLSVADLTQLFDEHQRPDNATLREALRELGASFDGRALELLETASGWRVQVRTEFAAEVGRLWPERAQRYSRALLETLALVAYRQPITRAEIEGVRGVAVNPNIIKTLMERNWLRVVGHREVPGRPELLATTREFLDYFGLKKIEDLPPLAELKALADSHLQMDLPGTTELDAIDPDAIDPDGTEAARAKSPQSAAHDADVASGGPGDETVYSLEASDEFDDDEADADGDADVDVEADPDGVRTSGAGGALVAAPLAQDD